MPTADHESGNDPAQPWLMKLQELQEEEAARYAGHEFDEDGWHDEEHCRVCLEAKAVINACRCGECCRRLLIEADLEDAKREPEIAERGDPIYEDPRLTASGKRELIGYLLNNKVRGDMACVFLDQGTNLCTIWQTRPLLCRLFDCDGEGRERLIQLGILERVDETKPDGGTP